ncbi:hypothetical protein GII30_22900 [Gordonia amarae]|uniref:DUF5926 domain-containing protein n=2 Tax=Gordonia amarae TaxID=36821 RepID=G7GTG4_9ACTN|nr:DUF5926 family protein [Gordonia amarae]MCS3876635.1 hypothetical protein [Gordonia amarae]QHN19522.1 hypothetical protein GII35_23360 [Gordonia amarae]QHN23998.1 hypothetical protein GII34_22860 [Gordonia amarae]QHN32907.1 hypothetical protein GII32_23190 [Gordonia amarae]QHN41627.1 hypothetical protein GII30_22900 [Gordonia amarae]
MAKKSKRGSGPRPGSNRAERVAARKARQEAALAAPPRPFAGLAAECDLVALRAFVASATADLTLAGAPADGRSIVLGTVLPGAVPGIVRETDGAPQAFVATQTDPEPADVTAALASAITWATTAEVGSDYAPVDDPAPLTELLVADATLDITVHNDFGWWLHPGAAVPPEVGQMLQRANDTILPTARLKNDSGIGAPWWVDAGDRAHLRWVRPEDEDDLMSALARVHEAGNLTLGEGSRFAGSFRTHGLLVPVFDLDAEKHPDEWTEALNTFDAQLVEALADTAELTPAQRRSRDGIRGRQVTLR